MKLPAEHFAELFESLGSVHNQGTGRETRRAVRLEYQTSATITYCTGELKGQSLTVTVKDFSSRGVRILHATPLPPGAQFIVEIPRKKSTPVAILCTVMHMDKARNNQFSIGAEFTCVAPAQITAEAGDGHEDTIKRIRESIID